MVLLKMPPLPNVSASIVWIAALLLWSFGAVFTLLVPVVAWLLRRHDGRS